MESPYTGGSTPTRRLIRTDGERIAFIRDMVFESLEDDLVTWVARRMTAGCSSRDERCEINAVYSAVKTGPIPIPTDGGAKYVPALRFVEMGAGHTGLRFVDDPRGTDAFPTAGRILRWVAEGANGEDCDGHTILICSLLHILGFQTGAVIVNLDGKEFTHVFPVVGLPKRDPTEWLPVDTTVKEARPGWMPGASYGVKAMRVYAFLQDSPLIGRDL